MLHLNFTPFPILLTDRLVLRSIELKDAPEIFAIRSNTTINRYIYRNPPANIDDAQAFITLIQNNTSNNQAIMWGISLKDDDKIIGTIVLWHIEAENEIAEVGYELHPDFHRKGIMDEALKAVLRYGFDVMKLKKIKAFTHRDNSASRGLLSHNNFVIDHKLEAHLVGKSEPQTTTIYSLKNIF